MTDSTAPATTNPKDTETACTPAIKSLVKTGLSDFRTVFFYPLCTGIMTGVGFIVGKRIGELYFYSGAKVS